MPALSTLFTWDVTEAIKVRPKENANQKFKGHKGKWRVGLMPCR